MTNSTRTRHKFDLYKTPSKLTEKLLEQAAISGTILECCADGDETTGGIAKVLAATGCDVWTSDIRPGVSRFTIDAANPDDWFTLPGRVDYVVTNPPFSLAESILPNAMLHARVGVYFLLRLSYMEP